MVRNTMKKKLLSLLSSLKPLRDSTKFEQHFKTFKYSDEKTSKFIFDQWKASLPKINELERIIRKDSDMNATSPLLNRAYQTFSSLSDNLKKPDTANIDELFLNISGLPAILSALVVHVEPDRSLEEKKIILPDPAIPKSFDSDLSPVGAQEKQRLTNYTRKLSILYKNGRNKFHSPILNVCQSSGSGKSKIAFEMSTEFPSCFVTLRKEGDTGYPRKSMLSELFFLKHLDDRTLVSVTDDLTTSPLNSVFGWYLLLLESIFKDYATKFRAELGKNDFNLESTLLTMANGFLRENLFGSNITNFKILISSNDPEAFEKRPISEIIAECRSSLSEIQKIITDRNTIKSAQLTNMYLPFLLIIDEASLLAEISSPHQKDKFRILRRALSYLGFDVDFVCVTLGTNSSITDLNPSISSDSHRESTGDIIFPPFILNKNWDIFIKSQNFDKIVINQKNLLKGRMLLLLYSLGRPLWGSISMNSVIQIATEKLMNSSFKSGETFLALWMIRTGVLINPSHVLTEHLVKSVMATIVYSSADRRYTRIAYPSEPVLSIAARNLVRENLLSYYQVLEKFISCRAIDSGRYAEIIAADICLQAMEKSTNSICDWVSSEGLPDVCRTNSHILECVESPEVKKTRDPTIKLSEVGLLANYKVVKVDSFLKNLYGEDLFKEITKSIPSSILNGLINFNHFVQIHRDSDFPFSTVFPDLPTKLTIQKSPRGSKSTSSPCNIITIELLKTGLLRQCAYMMPEGYFGIDFLIPVSLERSNQVTYIAVQVKKGSGENIKEIMVKSLAQKHIVACPLHEGCNNPTCPTFYDVSEVFGNQVMLNFVMNNGQSRNKPSSQSSKRLDGMTIWKEHSFVPDFYEIEPFGNNIVVSTMGREKENVKITCVESIGISPFHHLLGDEVDEIIKRILNFDVSIFNGIDPDSIKEVGHAVIARGNDGSYPSADNFMRAKLGLTALPLHVDTYQDLSIGIIEKAIARIKSFFSSSRK